MNQAAKAKKKGGNARQRFKFLFQREHWVRGGNATAYQLVTCLLYCSGFIMAMSDAVVAAIQRHQAVDQPAAAFQNV